jgi:hypothetical protein
MIGQCVPKKTRVGVEQSDGNLLSFFFGISSNSLTLFPYPLFARAGTGRCGDSLASQARTDEF